MDATEKLTRLARRLGYARAQVVKSGRDVAGKYLLSQGVLPLTGLGWTVREAAETLRRLAAEAK